MNKKYLSISIIIIASFIAGAIFGINYYIKQVLPLRWLTYQDNNIGITFKYPPNLKTVERGFDISLNTDEGVSVPIGINIGRYFGFGSQGGIENIIKQIGHDPNVKTISENGKTAIFAFQSEYPENKRLYIVSDDALFDIELYNIDPNEFLKNLEFTKPQVLFDYKTIQNKSNKTIVNLKQGYQIDIPNNLGISFIEFSPNNIGVSFSEPYYFRPISSLTPIISVDVVPTSLKDVKDAFFVGSSKFEKNITVDGVNGALGGLVEESNIKIVNILNNDLLYSIIVQQTDYTKVLEGFKFLKP